MSVGRSKSSSSNTHRIDAMAFRFTTRLGSLSEALECGDWKKVQHILSTISTSPPDILNPIAITSAIEQVRAAADAIVEACDFNRAFESSFITRRALIRHGTAKWALKALRGFSFDERLVSRVATVLALLGNGDEARTIVGEIGAVDYLTTLWGKYPSNVEIVKSLVSLCAGHIHNVSRVMRQRGIAIAIKVISSEKYLSNDRLLEQTLITVGICAMCIPDTLQESEHLVPALLDLLQQLTERKNPETGRYVITALGNVADCWIKEGHGYELDNGDRIVEMVLSLWCLKKKCAEMAAACCWVLASLHTSILTRACIENKADSILKLADPWKDESKTAQLLVDAMEQIPPKDSAPDEPETTSVTMNVNTTPSPAKRPRKSTRSEVMRQSKMISSDPEVEVVDLEADESLLELEFQPPQKKYQKKEKKTPRKRRAEPIEPFEISVSCIEDCTQDSLPPIEDGSPVWSSMFADEQELSSQPEKSSTKRRRKPSRKVMDSLDSVTPPKSTGKRTRRSRRLPITEETVVIVD